MAFQIMWTEPVIEDVQGIVRYLAQQDLQAAEQFGTDLMAKVDLLATQPYMGERFDAPDCAVRRQLLLRPYRIFYRVLDDIRRIEILHVRHSARA